MIEATWTDGCGGAVQIGGLGSFSFGPCREVRSRFSVEILHSLVACVKD